MLWTTIAVWASDIDSHATASGRVMHCRSHDGKGEKGEIEREGGGVKRGQAEGAN